MNKGDRVIYIPNHANGDAEHKDCEHGVVKRVARNLAFVIYDNAVQRMITGDEPYTAAATLLRDLVIEGGTDERSGL